jgi:hypothetical protein
MMAVVILVRCFLRAPIWIRSAQSSFEIPFRRALSVALFVALFVTQSGL